MSTRRKQIEGLFHAAKELPLAARAAFLEASCAGDEALRREVQSLLAQDAEAEGPIDRPIWNDASDLLDDGPDVPLASGTTVGPYIITGLLGVGGMGRVYRAHDSRLGRSVAIKFVHARFSERFQREARAIAALNHPSICTLHDVGPRYLVMEIVEGPTLAERISGKPLPALDALAIARQLAGALDAAHERGIVHRDLKPANIKLTKDGTVKVLDFGLATAVAVEAGEASEIPTQMVSQPGMVLGTPAYMSPEQARGQAVDKRADIWAFGCVLFEMLTGRAAFGGETASDVMANVLQHEPDWNALPVTTALSVRRILERCLDKDQRRRMRDIGDVHFDEVRGETGRPAGLSWRAGLGVAGLGAVAGIVGAVFGARFYARPTAPTAASGTIRVRQLTEFVGMEESPAISPDGRTVAFVRRSGAHKHIWLRLMAGGSPLQITHDDGDHEAPRWTPDSSALVYYVRPETPGEQGTIWELPALGGTPRRIAQALSPGDVSHDGRRVAYFAFDGTGIYLVVSLRDGPGAEQRIPIAGNDAYDYLRWSPDDRSLAFERINSNMGGFTKTLEVASLSGGPIKDVLVGSDMRGIAWLPDGSGLVYSSAAGSTVLYPPTFNLRVVRVDGSGDRPLTFGEESYTQPDVHASGLVLSSRIRVQSDVWRFPTTGTPLSNTQGATRITVQTAQAQVPSVSPDGRELVYLSDDGGHGNLWVVGTDGSNAHQITFEQDPTKSVGVPVWSTTGGTIAFILSQPGHTGLSLINSDGSGQRDIVPVGVAANWSGDGHWLYYHRQQGGHLCIEKVTVDGGAPVSVRCDEASQPAISRDGSTLYYDAHLNARSGRFYYEIRKAQPEGGAFEVLARVASSRVPVDESLFAPILSPDEKFLSMLLTDGTTSNIWLLPTGGGALRALTDFGDRSILIARRTSWSADGRFIYAAVADADGDIVALEGLVSARAP